MTCLFKAMYFHLMYVMCLYLSDVSCKSCSMKVNKMFVFATTKKKYIYIYYYHSNPTRASGIIVLLIFS